MQAPLHKIITFGNRLQEKLDALNDESSEYLKQMQNSAQRMSEYINDLFECSKATQEPKRFEKIPLKRLVTQVLDDLKIQIENEHATIHLQTFHTLEVDPGQFSKLIQNLLSNAIKYHRENVAPIVTIVSSFSENNREWKIEVSDNGIGIQEKHFSQIFKPFERLHGKSTINESGIGLAICKQIIHNHHGKISVRCNPIHGATFVVTLPENQQS